MVTITGSNYSPSGDLQGPFLPIVLPNDANTQSGQTSQKLDLSTAIPVAPAENFLSGELLFLQVDFIGANKNSAQIETFEVIVESEIGDSITLQLFESGEDSGEFWAVLPSKSGDVFVNDDTLTMRANTDITATATNRRRCGNRNCHRHGLNQPD